jgi:hypothetical protein
LFSDFYVEDASYIRIQNIQLGYSLNPRYIEKAGITKVRLYAGVNNLYTFTNTKDLILELQLVTYRWWD